MSDTHPEIHYSDSLEKILKKAAEEFSCLRKTHDDAERLTAKYNTYFTIPTIILSGLAGLGAIGSQSLLPFDGSETLVGLISFTCATLQTISSFLAFSRRSESHRQAAIQYAKLHQTISLELSLPREERMPADKLMALVKDESSRLLDTAPQLPQKVIDVFKRAYGHEKKVAVPTVLNGLEEVKVATLPEPTPATPLTPIRPKITVVAV